MPDRRAIGFIWVLLVALTALCQPALADCVSECQSSVYCDSTESSSECARKLNDCYLSQCNRPSYSFGAIAYGAQSQAFGFSYDQADQKAAERVALTNCQKHGTDCEIVAGFVNGCAAVAAGKDGKYATGEGASHELAGASALAACAKAGGGNCEIQVWSCALR